MSELNLILHIMSIMVIPCAALAFFEDGDKFVASVFTVISLLWAAWFFVKLSTLIPS